MLEPKVHMYTYNIQYVNFRWDVKKEMGQIDAAGAINAFRSFPFREQQEKAQNLSAPTAPTISFVSRNDGATLFIWSYESNNYELYFECEGKKATFETKSQLVIVELITSFFAGSRVELLVYFKCELNAITKRSFLNKLKSIFTR